MNFINYQSQVFRITSMSVFVLFLAGCATVDRKASLQQSSEALKKITTAQLPENITSLPLAVQDQDTQQQLEKLLKSELKQADSVQLFLLNSPNFNTLLANAWRQQATAAQTGRIPNPVFSFERVTGEHGLEIGRVLSLGLLDLLTLPAKQAAAESWVIASNFQLSSQVVEQVVAVQHAWVDAVLAQQKKAYAEKVLKSAEASSILAKRMQAAGNFTRMQAVRQQLFYSDSAVNLANAKHEWIAKKEHLVRLLGLTAEQSAQLKLPSMFAKLPEQPLSAQEVASQATDRLDIKMAKHQYDAVLQRYGVDKLSSFIDVELGLIREYESEDGERASANGYELEFKLPLFDWGDAKREMIHTDLLLAKNNLQAVINASSSHLRQGYSAYRTAYDIAKHYRQEVEPMQQILAEENSYLYNGMFIGVFKLIQDGKSQIMAYENSMQAQANFWKSLASLNATMVGKPTLTAVVMSIESGANAGGDDH